MKGTSAYKALMVAALVVALSVLALTGCVSVRVDKSGAASSGTTDSGSSASGVTLISSDSASTGTSTTSSSASASSTSTPSQATVTPTNQLVEVRNSAGGYAFMTDKAFYTTEEGKGTMTLTETDAGECGKVAGATFDLYRVKTGDETRLFPLYVAMVVSGGLLMALVVKTVREEREERKGVRK